MKKFILYTTLLLIVAYLVSLVNIRRKIDKWDWKHIDTNAIEIPKNFIWGTASCAYQVEGHHDTTDNWGWWETQKDSSGKPRVVHPNGIGNDEWNLYPKDIENMKWLGVNAYRLSVSWSKIFPAKDSINESALQHYDTLINQLITNHIEPNITLHHFHHPLWFDKLGGFEDINNLKHFIQFAAIVYKRFGNRVQLFTSFNEPSVFAYGKYAEGTHPFCNSSPDFQKMGNLLKNILIAHDAVYDTIHSLAYKNNPPKVGIIHSQMQMDPLNNNDLGDVLIAHFAEKLYSGALLNYFSKGVFDFKAFPVGVDIVYKNPEATKLDFVGLNYYSHLAFDLQYPSLDIDKASIPICYPNEAETDLGYGFYPEGLYRAIREVSVLKKPIYITENGIAFDGNKELLKQQHLKTALFCVSKAIADGYDVKGYYYWSLNDNYEWQLGFDKKFGLFSVNRNTLERTPKGTAYLYKSIIEKCKTP